LRVRSGSPVTVAVRPERIELLEAPRQATGGDGINVFPVHVEERTYLGAHHQVLVRVGKDSFRVDCDSPPSGDTAFVRIPPESCIVFQAPADR
jgi:ABC-type Fe3+/spermidine/putrescine transport system ATPase subunit